MRRDSGLPSLSPEKDLEQTRVLEPALLDRFGGAFELRPLSDDDAFALVLHRLRSVREGGPRRDIVAFRR